MAVQMESLEILEQASFSQAQARAIARVIEAEAPSRRDDLATKLDLLNLKTELMRSTFAAILGQTAVLTDIMYVLVQAVTSHH